MGEAVDLDEPRPTRFEAYGADGEVVKDGAITGDEMMAPRQLAHHLLHVEGVTRVRVFDLLTDGLLLEQADPVPGD